MKKKILAIYYSQTGQSIEILESTLSPLKTCDDIELTLERLQPEPAFPFPWSADAFMQVFPESVQGIACNLKPLELDAGDFFDLIILVWQPWYLSPSIPIQSFLKLPEARLILAGKPVVCITGCRNMWIKGYEDIFSALTQIEAIPVGNIALTDRSPNLVSIITILRWLIQGRKKSPLNILPPAGVSEKDIKSARNFGITILSSIRTGDYERLQEKLVDRGALKIYPALLNMEKTGKRIFKKWAPFILKKGPYGSRARNKRLVCFKYYLLTVIFLVSPLISFFTWVYGLFKTEKVKKELERYLLVAK